MHGTGSFEHVNLPLRATRVPPACQTSQLYFDQGKLKALSGAPPCSGTQLQGTAFEVSVGGQLVQFEIREVRPHRSLLEASNPNESQSAIPGEAPWEYRVVWKRGAESGALCSTGEGFALAVPYGWSPDGDLLDGSQKELFTFACRPDKTEGGFFIGGGVIAKCVDWGYPPWRRARSTVVNGQATTYTESVAVKYHQACVRMAAADYCNEGKAHTLDGTPIAFYDATGFRTTSGGGTVSPGPVVLTSSYYPGNYYLEAIWGIGKDGKIGVLCLGKTRWETLSKDATCDLHRRLGVEPAKPVEICEELPVTTLEKRGLLLISYSTFLDKALVRFRRGNEGISAAFLTTGAVEWKPNSAAGQYIWPDLYRPALIAPEYTNQVMVEGAIFAPHIPREFIDRFKLKPLYRCSAGGLFLTTDTADCGQLALSGPRGTLEGYIASEKTGIKDNPLYLWKRTRGGAYATSTVQPANYESPRLLGYLPSVSQLAER